MLRKFRRLGYHGILIFLRALLLFNPASYKQAKKLCSYDNKILETVQ
jgi:hypothetical protein